MVDKHALVPFFSSSSSSYPCLPRKANIGCDLWGIDDRDEGKNGGIEECRGLGGMTDSIIKK